MKSMRLGDREPPEFPLTPSVAHSAGAFLRRQRSLLSLSMPPAMAMRSGRALPAFGLSPPPRPILTTFSQALTRAPSLQTATPPPRAPPRARAPRPRAPVAWARPARGAGSAARVRAAAGPLAIVCAVGAEREHDVVAAAGVGGVVFVGRGGWGACGFEGVVRRFARLGVRCLGVDEGGSKVPVGVGAAAVGAAVSIDRPVVVEVENGLKVDFLERHKGQKGLERRREKDERGQVERILAFLRRVYLPAGYPHSVSSDYLNYTAYRMTQNLASAIMTVLSTECLLYSVGLGGKVKATAAASAWVLKDGLGYMTKVIFGSVCGRQFDLDPKSWRVAADIIEDVGGAIEVVMPLITFPGSFVIVASLTNVLKGAAAMTGSATRHVIYRQLTAGGSENIGDVATKGESQGVTCKALGLLGGVTLSKRLGQNYTALLSAYGLFAIVHLAANWRSMECVQFSFFNKQRLSIALGHVFDGRPVPSPMEVSKEERIILPPWIGYQGRVARVGTNVATAIESVEQFREGRSVFKGERFLVTRSKRGKLNVLLHADASSNDSVRAYYTVQKFLRSDQLKSDPRRVARLDDEEYTALMLDSLSCMKKEVKKFVANCKASGWNTSQVLVSDSDVRVLWP